jgi:cytoskeletal protein RodZ
MAAWVQTPALTKQQKQSKTKQNNNKTKQQQPKQTNKPKKKKNPETLFTVLVILPVFFCIIEILHELSFQIFFMSVP